MKELYITVCTIIQISIILGLIPFVYDYIPIKKGSDSFYLPSSNVSDIIDTLQSHRYDVSTIDKIMLFNKKAPSKGWYTLDSKEINRFTLFKLLKLKNSKVFNVRIFEGETSKQLTQRLANDLNLNPMILLKYYKNKSLFKEGDIIAGKYKIAKKSDEYAVINGLYTMSNNKINKFVIENNLTQRANKNYLNTLLTTASIIQKETNNPEEMYLISSVIQNRLEKNMRLQMDGTLNYGKYTNTPVTSEHIKTDKSSFNTYRKKGLPPTPICNVSLAALNAAYNPKETNYIYFMLNNKGLHDFSISYEEHIKYIKAFKKLHIAKKPKDNNQTNKEINITVVTKLDTTEKKDIVY